LDDRRRDGGTNSTLRTKEQGKHLTLNEHDDDDDDKYLFYPVSHQNGVHVFIVLLTKNT